jgi:hypothetical protein
MLNRRPSPAMIVAIVGLVVAMGGTGYAALKLPRNSVGAKQIKRNAVSSAKVKDKSPEAGGFADGQLPAGPKGDKGDPGENPVKLWASARANATLVRGSGVKTVGREQGEPVGTYLIRFNQPLTACTFVVTQVAGPGAGEIAVEQYSVADTVNVQTATSNASALSDRNFNLIVAC